MRPADATTPARGPAGRAVGEAGLTLVEVLVAMAITLVVVLGALAVIDSSTRDHLRIVELSTTESQGRVAIELMAAEVLAAGYDPLGARFDAVPEGNDSRIRLVADLDADGVVSAAGEADEDLWWELVDPDGDGLHDLRRGVDLNGDGDFEDEDESVQTIAVNLVLIDADGDGSLDPFLAYDAAPPDVRRVVITFGSRVERDFVVRAPNRIRWFVTEVVLRNRSRGGA